MCARRLRSCSVKSEIYFRLIRRNAQGSRTEPLNCRPSIVCVRSPGLFLSGQRAVVTGRVLAVRDHHGGGFAPSTKEDENPAVYEGRIGQDVLYSNNMALHKSAIVQIGYFDERLCYR